MKLKIITLIMTLFVLCSCSYKKEPMMVVQSSYENVEGLDVDYIIRHDNNYMMTHWKNFKWLCLQMKLHDYADTKDYNGSVDYAIDIFRTGKFDYDINSKIVTIFHTLDTIIVDVSDNSLYDDYPMHEWEIRLSYEDAWRTLKNSENIPHSKYVKLHKEVGPIKTNPQYVFGHKRGYMYINATTGIKSKENPSTTNDNEFLLE